ncbi:MAG: hypothetical protein ACNA8L_01965 [Luteolibacter sp.]|jgi:hypothetical protein
MKKPDMEFSTPGFSKSIPQLLGRGLIDRGRSGSGRWAAGGHSKESGSGDEGDFQIFHNLRLFVGSVW